jgi:4-hydroxythreonine-4-phosphate dehydrogenase
MGDPAGIGPELCLRALQAPEVLKICTPVLFGNMEVLKRVSRSAKLSPVKCRTVSPSEFNGMAAITGPLIVDCNGIDARKVKKATVSAACGRAAYDYIEESVKAALAGKIAGVVTAPIHKESLHLAGVKYPGHTEIFTALTRAPRSCMMLYSEILTVSMVTTHIGFVDVPQKISTARILDVIELTAAAMKRLRRRTPRLAICGLNPHAGENGLFGKREEERFVVPAVAKARRKKIQIDGPLPPDAAFTTGQRKKYDAIVCLYHDQGHIPFKMLAFDTGVNVTLGLPIIRTSVDHGTAFDIAWRGKADPTSLYAAVRVAANMAEANL